MQEHSRLEPYTLHVFDISYFSGKMQAYLAYKGIPHRTHEIGWAELVDRIAPRTGLVEVPVVECADGTVLRDSTAMIEWFEQRYRDVAVLPEDPAAAFYCRLLEDYADVERHYRDELADLEAVFRLRPFLFGDRPSLADFGYFASMFRHFGIDPTPSRIMRNRAPAVYEWVARLWNARCGAYRQAGWAVGEGGQPAGLEPLLARAARRYLPALHANARAVAGRRRRYTATLEGRSYPRLRAVPFQAWRRSVLQRELARLPTAAAGPVRATLTRTGCLDWLERDGVLESGYEEGDRLPQCTPRRFGLASRMRLRLFGTPHHLAAPGSRP